MPTICKPYKEAQLGHVSQSFHSNHLAVDFAYKYGTFLVAPEDCKVVKVVGTQTIDGSMHDLDRGNGIMLQSLDNPNVYFEYWHTLIVFLAKVGDNVKQGQPLCQMGNTGYVKSGGVIVPLESRNKPPYLGTHVHYSMLVDQVYVDPLKYIDWIIPVNYDWFSAIRLTLLKMLNFFK